MTQDTTGRRRQSSYRTPSPAMVLSQAEAARRENAARPEIEPIAAQEIAFDPFTLPPAIEGHAAALAERGLLQAPLMTRWRYRVNSAHAFARWLATKEIVLAEARLRLQPETAGICYLGTTLEPEASRHGPATVTTAWGFQDRAALTHLHDLGGARIPRTSIIQNDIADFLVGLRRHIREGGPQHFRQRVQFPAALM